MYKIGILNFTKVFRSGGGFHYIMTLIEGLKNNKDYEIYVYYDDMDFREYLDRIPEVKGVFIEPREGRISNYFRSLCSLLGIRSPILGRYSPLLNPRMDLLLSFGEVIGFHLDIPFLSFIGDVMYRHFPELSEYTLRERIIRNLANKRLLNNSELVILDSNESAKDLMRFFNIGNEKLVPIPLCAPPHIYKYRDIKDEEVSAIIAKYNLPEGYLIYPAQFWAHKNHVGLIKALDQLRKEYNIFIPTVFTGASWDNQGKVIDLIKELKMQDQIFILGYLPDKEIVAIYKRAKALVFASFAEYTNIPVLEAMTLGIPVLCANTFSMPEQVGTAGLLFDPHDVNDIANKIYEIVNNDELACELINSGYKRIEELSPENFIHEWTKCIEKTFQKKLKMAHKQPLDKSILQPD